jgi:GntR family transcriptional regulator
MQGMKQPPTRSGRVARPAATGEAFSPLYRQIKVLITQDMQSGVWKPGEVIPSEFELAERFKVS